MDISSDDIIVAGMGLAGSLLSLRLAESGFKVKAFEPTPSSYVKPCGEQLTLEEVPLRLAKEYEAIKTVVNDVHILVNGKYVTTVDMRGGSKWAIIDKPKLIMELRRSAAEAGVAVLRERWHGERGALTIDSRGPYSMKTSSEVLALRVIAKVKSWSPEEAILDFRPSLGGLYWVFPFDGDGKFVNAGTGFVGVNDAASLQGLVRSYLAEKLQGPFDVVEVKGAPINVFTNPRLTNGDIIKVGEAAGLVMAWSGEGNRPAIVSAEALASSIANSDYNFELALKRYSTSISWIMESAIVSRLLTRASYRLSLAAPLLASMPRRAWELYMRQELTLRDLISFLPEALKSATLLFNGKDDHKAFI
jgi:flavin-dependent dehydrogenase